MISAARPIASVEDLRDHLQYAIGIELTTIPAYLCALYSIDPDTNTAAYEVVQSVVLEEMLHMGLAANVLNAIGGVPSTAPVGDGPSPVPSYPTNVPFIERIPTIHLQPFSPQALDEFIAIERPDASGAGGGEQYGSIGAFYAAIESGLRRLCPPDVFESARSSRAGCQLTAVDYYGGAGTIVEVVDLDSALDALAMIVREGEGVPATILDETAAAHAVEGATMLARPHTDRSVDDNDRLRFGWKMYSHYARFLQLRAGRYFLPDQLIGDQPVGDVLPIDWGSVKPMTPDPKAHYYHGTWAYQPMVDCNVAYTSLVDTIYASFDGNARAMEEAVHAMYDLKYLALSLMNMPSPGDGQRTLGPAFEYLAG
ncbi:MAG: ferritin-like protein [Acidimicrobiales bacterium]